MSFGKGLTEIIHMKIVETDYFLRENFFLKSFARLKYFDRIVFGFLNRDAKVSSAVNELRKNGFVLFPDFIKPEELKYLQEQYARRLENEMEFETPCLAQTLIDPERHNDLIKNKFKVSDSKLQEIGVTFSSSDFSSYEEVVEKHKPSTLKTYIPQDMAFFKIWLNPFILKVIEKYLGVKPYLFEAYIRRNFPAKYKVMNHYWHRDTNNKQLLLKAFIFLTDCEVDNGPHEYISGSIQDLTLNGKTYYEDHEVDALYPEGSPNRIVSVVKAGTLILEDTRGLHRAKNPFSGHRDLGYAVFMPKTLVSKVPVHYKVSRKIFENLDAEQKEYIPQGFVY